MKRQCAGSRAGAGKCEEKFRGCHGKSSPCWRLPKGNLPKDKDPHSDLLSVGVFSQTGGPFLAGERRQNQHLPRSQVRMSHNSCAFQPCSLGYVDLRAEFLRLQQHIGSEA